MADKQDYYETLGLSKGAGADEIKKAWTWLSWRLRCQALHKGR